MTLTFNRGHGSNFLTKPVQRKLFKVIFADRLHSGENKWPLDT